MKPFLAAALIAALPLVAEAQAYDPLSGAPPARPAATTAASAPQGDPSLCNSGRKEPPVGARPATYTWTELWPINAHCYTYGMGDLKFPVASAANTAFDDATAVPCSDCEGGKAYDGWASHFIAGGVDAKLAALTPGAKVTWKGNRLNGEITLIGEEPIGRFPCRQFRWVMKGAAGKVVAERTGLLCRRDSGKWGPMY